MATPTATAVHDLPTRCASPAPRPADVRPAVVVLVVAVLLVAALAPAAVFGAAADLAATALLGAWAGVGVGVGVGLIVVMAGLPLLLELADRPTRGEAPDDRCVGHPDRHTRSGTSAD